jgi:ribosomal protein L34
MKTNIRLSSLKQRKRTGFRRRMKTKAGRQIINNQRARACGRKKPRKGG